jgi:hypothetical protein
LLRNVILDEEVSSIEKQQPTVADIANQILMARLRLKNAPPMSAEARSALFKYRNLIQQQINQQQQLNNCDFRVNSYFSAL